MQKYSAWAPSFLDGHIPKTRSPGLNMLTAAPTASIIPAKSMPRMVRRDRQPPFNSRIRAGKRSSPQSVRLTVAAWTRTSTSFGPGTGAGTLRTSITPADPYRAIVAAFIGPRCIVRRLAACDSVLAAEGKLLRLLQGDCTQTVTRVALPVLGPPQITTLVTFGIPTSPYTR